MSTEKQETKRVMLIGRSFAGKTTMCQFMNHEALRYSKTQSVTVVDSRMIDTTGEYLERSWMRGALQVTSFDADVIIFVQDATEDSTMFPPSYASLFMKPTIGVVTKSGIATEEQIARAKSFLALAGAEKIFATSGYSGEGFAPLMEKLGCI